MMARSRCGHISVMYTATPTDSGTASSSARNDETSVPIDERHRSKLSLTGSQSCP